MKAVEKHNYPEAQYLLGNILYESKDRKDKIEAI